MRGICGALSQCRQIADLIRLVDIALLRGVQPHVGQSLVSRMPSPRKREKGGRAEAKRRPPKAWFWRTPVQTQVGIPPLTAHSADIYRR